MSKPLKQIIRFSYTVGAATDKANAWLSDRENEKYDTEIFVTGGDYAAITIVYWESES